jgi:hypothetical protein
VIVYGDPGREESIEAMVAVLREGVARTSASCTGGRDVSCDELRRVLIQAGELEQAVFDSPSSLGPRRESRKILRSFRSATSLAAAAFHHACERSGKAKERLVPKALARMLRSLDAFPQGGAVPGKVWVKVPEGFAFHGLFPERYREAALRWVEEHSGTPDGDVLVVGIRSIGTTLSAVVAATLRAHGRRTRRITVRPTGDPSARRLRMKKLRPAEWGLIVDEGPGLSGTSLLAVADALAAAGVPHIHFFPAHDQGPGAQAGVETHARWKEYPAFCSPLDQVRLGGLGLGEALWSSLHPGEEHRLSRVVECGGGGWRSVHYKNRDAWPAVCRTFERPKILCEGEGGRKILYKFAGFATAPGSSSSVCESLARRLTKLAREGFTSAPLGTAHGFVATEWLDGRPLTPSDATPDLLRRIGGYIAAAGGPPLSLANARAARTRLETMLCANTREGLGDEAAGAALSILRPIPVLEAVPRAGDGHLAPHEWIATDDGRVLKTDAGGHELDHTWTGQQPILWDLAGAILEWDLDGAGEAALLEGFAAAHGCRCAPLALDAYRIAYAAHRLGQVRVGADMEREPEERSRLESDVERWRGILVSRLGTFAQRV